MKQPGKREARRRRLEEEREKVLARQGDRPLIAEALKVLPVEHLAALVARDRRTVERWRDGDNPIPATARIRLEDVIAHPKTCPICRDFVAEGLAARLDIERRT